MAQPLLPRHRLAAILLAVLAPPVLGLGTLAALIPGREALISIVGIGSLVLAGLLALGPMRAATTLAAELQRRRDEAEQAMRCRRAMEQELVHSADLLRAMVSALPVGVVILDRHGKVELWNAAAEIILGYSAEQMLGRPPTEVFMPGEDSGAAANLFLRMVTGQLIKGEEVRCRRPTGKKVDVLFSGAPLLEGEDRVRGAICVFEDISQRKAVAEQLQHAQKMEAVGQLTGGMAHDFNNILGVAIGNLDLLQAGLEDPEAAELVESALNALLRGAELTRALLAFARRQPLQPVRTDPAELLAGTTRMLGRMLGEQIHLSFHVEGEVWPLLVDPAQLESAITNLAINARDAMPGGGTLTISVRATVIEAEDPKTPDLKPGPWVVIEVIDTGSGMPPEVMARVFEPFFTTKGVGHGTGLGLSMVYGFTKQSGGQVKLYSEPGFGTVVRLYLPPAPEEAGVLAAAVARDQSVRGGHESILVVEDNADMRRMAEGQLLKLGYRVHSAEHGPAALDLLRRGLAVDLLFTDVVMPEGMTGFELVEVARELRPGLKALVTSGFPGGNFELPRSGLGQIHFLGKPYRRQDLARAVREALDGEGGKP